MDQKDLKKIIANRRPAWISKRAWEASKKEPTLPVFECTPISPTTMEFHCPFCRYPHSHGRGADGLRTSHCEVFTESYIVTEKKPAKK